MAALLLLLACSRSAAPDAVAPDARWTTREPWAGAQGLWLAREGERAWVVDEAGRVRSGPFVRAEAAPPGGFGRGWTDAEHFQLLGADGRTRVADAFTALEPFDAADRAFAAQGPAQWGLLTRDALWLVPSVARWHGPARVGEAAAYAFGSGPDLTVVDKDGVSVDVPARVEAACAGVPARPRQPVGCAAVADWAGAPRAHAEATSPDGRLRQRWYCGGVQLRELDGAELWTLPGFDSAAALALAEACGAPRAHSRARPTAGGVELRLGPPPA